MLDFESVYWSKLDPRVMIYCYWRRFDLWAMILYSMRLFVPVELYRLLGMDANCRARPGQHSRSLPDQQRKSKFGGCLRKGS